MHHAGRRRRGRSALEVGSPKKWAAGIPGVVQSLEYAFEQMGGGRSVRTLARLNQKHGFDCPSCAWPEPERRKAAEFCENGAKAVAEEATTRRVTRTSSRDAFGRRTRRADRPLARPAGPAHRADAQAGRRGPLRADQLGRGVRPDRRTS